MAERIFRHHYEPGSFFHENAFGESCAKIYLDREKARKTNEIKRLGNEIFTASHTPIKVEGKFVGLVSVFENVTKVQKLEQQIRREIHAKGFSAKRTFDDILGESPEINKAIRIAKLYSKTDFTILIEGESGTGKEFFAQSIHNNSTRRNGPFVAVNCTAIPENLLESELFGYETGAFTGARKEGRAGLFEMAHGGTLFLDEIGEISQTVQARLLRVLQEKEIMRVGGNKVIPIDVRTISATNRDLYQQTKEGLFRVDLYYRLNVLHLNIPPLRKRAGDIKKLCHAFAAKRNIKLDETFSRAYLPQLEQYSWPGNVRELESVIERYSLLQAIWDESTTKDDQLATLLGLPMEQPGIVPSSGSLPPGCTLKEKVEQMEYDIIIQTLAACNNDQAEAAQRLGIGKTTLWRKLQFGENNK